MAEFLNDEQFLGGGGAAPRIIPEEDFMGRGQEPPTSERPTPSYLPSERPTPSYLPNFLKSGPFSLPQPVITALGKREATQQEGVGMEGAPSRARATFGLGEGLFNEQQLAHMALREAYGQDVKTRVNRQGVVIFTDPKTGKEQAFNPPGPDWGDLAQAKVDIPQITAETVAGIAGGVAFAGGGPGGIVLGSAATAAVTAYAGTILRLGVLRDRGVPLSNEKIHQIAAAQSGLTLLGGIAVPIAGSIFKRLIVGPLPRSLTRQVSQEELRAGLDNLESLQGDVQGRFGQNLQATTGQTLGAGEVVAAEQAAMRRGAPGQSLADVQAGQADLKANMTGQTFGQVPGAGGEATVGADVLRAISPEQVLAPIRQEVDNAALQARSVAQQNFGIAGTAESPMLAGDAVREHLRKADEVLFAPYKARYEALSNETGVRIDLSPLRDRAQAMSKDLDERVLSLLADEDRKLVQQATGAGLRNVTVVDDIAQQAAVSAPASISAVQKTLSDLRDQLRRVDKGMSDKDRRVITELHAGLLEARNDALRQYPGLLSEVMSLEAAYRSGKTALDQGIVADIMKREEGGTFRMASEGIIQKVLSSESSARELAGILSNPEIPNGMMAYQRVQRGILGEYKRRVIDPETGIADVAKHDSFVRSNLESLRQFFSPDELRNFTSARQASAYVAKTQEAFNVARDRLQNELGVDLSSARAGDVIGQFYNDNNIAGLQKAREILQSTPDLLASFDARLKRRMFLDTTRYDANGVERVIDLSRLNAFLDSEKIGVAREVGGQQFIDDLSLMRRVLQVTDVKPITSTDDLARLMSEPNGALVGIARFLRVPFPPLSPRGRALTAYVATANEMTNRRVAKLLSDPQGLHRLMELKSTSLGSRTAQAVLGELGITMLSPAYAEAIAQTEMTDVENMLMER